LNANSSVKKRHETRFLTTTVGECSQAPTKEIKS
jgi:hypothetical protein